MLQSRAFFYTDPCPRVLGFYPKSAVPRHFAKQTQPFSQIIHFQKCLQCALALWWKLNSYLFVGSTFIQCPILERKATRPARSVPKELPVS